MPRIPLESSSDEHNEFAEINMIPLIDVMLVLLIIFMVAAPMSVSGIKVNLPLSASKNAAVEQKAIVLSITAQGRFFIDQNEIPEKSLGKKLAAMFEHREQKELYIRADRDVRYKYVVDAMTMARMAGVGKMAMLTVPQDATKSGKGAL